MASIRFIGDTEAITGEWKIAVLDAEGETICLGLSCSTTMLLT